MEVLRYGFWRIWNVGNDFDLHGRIAVVRSKATARNRIVTWKGDPGVQEFC